MSNSAFTPTVLTIPATAGSGSGQGEVNIVTNPSAVTDTSNWTAVGLSLTRDASGSPLDPVVPTGFNLSASATSQTVTSASLTVPETLRNKKLKLEFYYKYVSGSSFIVDVLDGSAVQYALSTDVSGTTTLAQTNGKFVCYIDTNSTSSLQVRLTSTGAGVMKMTQVIVGPGIQPQGAVVQEWLSYTSGSTVLPAGLTTEYRRVGNAISVRVVGKTTGTSSSQWVIGLPSGASIFGSFDNNQILPGNAEVEDSVSTGAIFHAAPVWQSATTFRIKVSDKTTNTYWGNTTPVAFASNTGYRVGIEMSASISEWAGSGTVQLAQNDVEYAFNSSTSTTTSDTTTFGYGPSGALIGSIANALERTVQFQTPIQTGDQLVLEVYDGTTWLDVNKALPFNTSLTYVVQNLKSYGMGIKSSTSTKVVVRFGTYATPSGATYDSVGAAWSGYGAFYWRVRKSSAGAAVGFGIVNPGSSAGLVSASGLPGNTTGNAIATGYVGEAISVNLYKAPTSLSAWQAWTDQTIILSAGHWIFVGAANSAGNANITNFQAALSSNTNNDATGFVVQAFFNGPANANVSAAGYMTNTTSFKTTASSTTLYMKTYVVGGLSPCSIVGCFIRIA